MKELCRLPSNKLCSLSMHSALGTHVTLRREKNGQKVTAFVQEIDAGTIRSEGKRIVTHQNLFQDVGTDSTRVECPLRLLTKVREAVPS